MTNSLATRELRLMQLFAILLACITNDWVVCVVDAAGNATVAAVFYTWSASIVLTKDVANKLIV